jgi:hypothetical protein
MRQLAPSSRHVFDRRIVAIEFSGVRDEADTSFVGFALANLFIHHEEVRKSGPDRVQLGREPL